MRKRIICPDCGGAGAVPVCCGNRMAAGGSCCGSPEPEPCGGCQGDGELSVDVPPGIPCSDALFAAIAAEDDDLPF